MNSKHTRKGKEVAYIHYGTTEFDPNRFSRPINRPRRIKPIHATGLWASPVNSECSWKHWCESEDFRECDDDNAFTFRVYSPEKIFFVDSKEAYEELTRLYGIPDKNWIASPFFIDYEKMIRDGWDGLEISISDYPRLYDLFDGWDCDSILIFNKDAVNVDHKDNIFYEVEKEMAI